MNSLNWNERLPDLPGVVLLKLDASGSVTDMNAYGCRLLRCSREQALGADWFETFLPESSRSRVRGIFRSMLAENTDDHGLVEETVRAADGELVSIAWHNMLLLDEAEEVVGTMSAGFDVGEYKELQRRHQEAEKRFQLALQSAGEGIWEWDFRSGQVTFDAAALRMLGLPEDTPPRAGEWWISRIHPDESNAVLEAWEEYVSGRSSGYRVEFRLRRGDRGYIWVHSTASIIRRDDRGQPLLAVGIHRDISGRKAAERALRESEARWRSYLDNAPYGIFVADADGVYLDVNPTACRITGYSREELIGMGVPDLLPRESKDRGIEHFRGLLKKGHDVLEVPFLTRDGRKRWWSVSAVVLEEDRFLGFVEDITDRKRAEEEKKSLMERLSKGRRLEAMGRLAGGVAHDFNNMLNVILGHTEMFRDELCEDSPLQERLAEIHGAADRSADLIRQLLAFARQQVVKPRPVDLNAKVKSLLRMLQRLIGEDIELAWRPAERLEAVLIDPAQLDQVLANLVVNARDAIKGVGKITIETSMAELDASGAATRGDLSPGSYVLLSVSDDGHGIDDRMIEHIFEPFYTSKEVGEGTGLGLATVYGIVKQNSGWIDVDSQPGMGAEFRIYLPAAPHAPEVGEAAQNEGGEPSPRGTATVLVAEDEGAILKMITAMLDQLGYDVLAASDPDEALVMAKHSDSGISLLITDVVMPGMNGRDLYDRVEKHHPGIRVLYMSGYTHDVITRKGVLEEEMFFLQKPFTMREMAAKVTAVLRSG